LRYKAEDYRYWILTGSQLLIEETSTSGGIDPQEVYENTCSNMSIAGPLSASSASLGAIVTLVTEKDSHFAKNAAKFFTEFKMSALWENKTNEESIKLCLLKSHSFIFRICAPINEAFQMSTFHPTTLKTWPFQNQAI